MEINKCNVCGKEFIVTPRMKTLCSAECRLESKRISSRKQLQKKKEEKRKLLGTRKCTVCGKEFAPKNSRQVRCSRACTREKSTEYKQEYRRVTKKQIAEEQKLREKKVNELVGMSVQAGNAHTTYGKLEMQNYLAKQSLEMAKRRRELDAEWERKRKNGNQ
jgi:hypothetical protein